MSVMRGQIVFTRNLVHTWLPMFFLKRSKDAICVVDRAQILRLRRGLKCAIMLRLPLIFVALKN